MPTQKLPQQLVRFLKHAEEIASREHRRWLVARGSGHQHTISCPAHDDANPSLSIGWDNGKVLLNCQAGCDAAEILDVLGLTWKDLEQPRQEVAVYSYRDEDDTLVYEVVRYQPKDFRQRRPDPKKPRHRIWDMQGVEPLPYRLPELAEALSCGEPVWIVEGERDVEAMALAYGVTATCNHGGAGKWKEGHSRRFVDSDSSVTIVADRDVAGYKHAITVYDSLREVAGITSKLVLPVSGKDAADHVGDHALDAFMPVTRAELRALIEAEESAKKSAFEKSPSSGKSPNSSATGRLVLRPASGINSRLQRFLWSGRIPLGALTLFAGRGGVGKSSFAIWLAVEAQHGRLPGDLRGEQVTILYVSVEDNWETQMKPRLVAAGADMDRFIKLSIGYTTDEDTGERVPNLPEDAPLLLQAIQLQSERVMLILDPITSSIQGDDHKRDVVRAVLDPLAKIAGETDAVILGIMHFNKGVGNASDKLSGSHAYRDAARAVMLFASDDDEGQIVMSQDKGNYSEHAEMSLAYRLVDTAVELDDGEVGHVARVDILGETSTSVSQIINRPQGEDGGVVEWLTDFMRSVGGRVAAGAGLETGRAEGFTDSQLTRGRKRARPKITSRKTGMNGGWEWVSEEVASREEVPGNTEEGDFLNSDAFTPSSATPSGKRAFRRVRIPSGGYRTEIKPDAPENDRAGE